MDTITVLGTTFVLFYCVIQVMMFYNVPANLYVIYLVFYVFLVLTYIMLGNS
jgi:hypothetical protein